MQPPKWFLIHKTTETILKLAQTGNVIIIGRAANIITEKLKNTFHVRLIAPVEDRIKRVQEVHNKSKEEAINYIKKEDANRKNYVSANFHKDVTNPLLYHLVLNTSLAGYDLTAEIIGKAVAQKFSHLLSIKSLRGVLR